MNGEHGNNKNKSLALTAEQLALLKSVETMIPPALRRFGMQDDEDAIQLARVFLCSAAQRFDPSKAKWSTYAWGAIAFAAHRVNSKARAWKRGGIGAHAQAGEDGRWRAVAEVSLEATDAARWLADDDAVVPNLERDDARRVLEAVFSRVQLNPTEKLSIAGFIEGNTEAATAEQIGLTRQAVHAARTTAFAKLRRAAEVASPP